MKRSVTFLIAILAVVVCVPAFAAARSANLNVTAQVNANCRITTVDVAFGIYDPIITNNVAPLDNTGSVTVTCTKGAAGVWVGLDLGTYPAAAVRNMANGANRLSYELYSDAGRTAVWGNTALTGATVTFAAGAGLADPTTLTVYGRVPGGQDVATGAYADVVQATVNY